MTTSKTNKSWIAGILVAVAASLCCITPVLAFVGGASGLVSSFSWIEPYRYYFIGATILIFAFAWYQKLKQPLKNEIACDCENDKPSFLQTKTFLAIITIVATLLIAFPYYSKIFYPKSHEVKHFVVDKSNIQTVQINISGMDCEGCTAHINTELSKINGVFEANTSYKNSNAIVKFDNSKIKVDRLTSAINDIGYEATLPNNINK